jgi:hypothetical protein
MVRIDWVAFVGVKSCSGDGMYLAQFPIYLCSFPIANNRDSQSSYT